MTQNIKDTNYFHEKLFKEVSQGFQINKILFESSSK